MEIDVSTLSNADVYKLMNCMVVPRPIAWVTTVSDEALVNLAPFSTFNIVCYDPPLLGINIIFREDGTRKDSSRNARLNQELVVHIADEPLLDKLHASSFGHPPEVSETDVLGLDLLPSIDVTVPRLRDAPLAIECRVYQVLSFGPTADYVVAKILRVHGRDGLIENYKIDSAVLRPLSRLAGPTYGTLGRTVVMTPPSPA